MEFSKRKAWSVLATYLFWVGMAIGTGSISAFWQKLNDFVVSGNIPWGDHSNLINVLYYIAPVVVIALPAAILSGIIANIVSPREGSHAVQEMFSGPGNGNTTFQIFSLLFGTVFLEEVFARLIPGLIYKNFLTTDQLFIVIALGFNAIWALAHLLNYKDKKDREWNDFPKVLPQFTAGLLFIFAYTLGGFACSFLAHFCYNGVLFAKHRNQDFNWVDCSRIVYSMLLVAIGILPFWLSDNSLLDAAKWLDSDTQSYAVNGWGFWEYVGAYLIVRGIVSTILNVLMYDQNDISSMVKQANVDINLEGGIGCIVLIGVLAISLFALYLLYTGLTAIGIPYPYIIIAFAVVLNYGAKSPTASAAYRAFFENIPLFYVWVCIAYALGIGGVICFLLVTILLSIPESILKQLDS